MFPGLRCPSRRSVADYLSVSGHRHVLAVALEGEGAFNKSLRSSFVSCGRARWTRVAHVDLRFARGAHRHLGLYVIDLRARRRREPSEAEGRKGRASIATGSPSILVPVFVPGRRWQTLVLCLVLAVKRGARASGHWPPRGPPLSNDLGAGGDGRAVQSCRRAKLRRACKLA